LTPLAVAVHPAAILVRAVGARSRERRLMRWMVLVPLTVLGAPLADAQGINDVLPGGQQGQPYVVQPYQPPSGTVATPNASGYFYQRQFYRQMYRPPRVHYRRHR